MDYNYIMCKDKNISIDNENIISMSQLVAAILFFTYAKGNTLFILYGILTLTLCGGDAFHLVPRIIRAVCGSSDKIKKQLGIGLQISSITMTAFYIILMYIWKFTFPGFTIPVIIEVIIWI